MWGSIPPLDIFSHQSRVLTPQGVLWCPSGSETELWNRCHWARHHPLPLHLFSEWILLWKTGRCVSNNSKTKNAGGLGSRTCVAIVDNRLHDILGTEVVEGEVTQAVVGLDQAEDYVNRRLPVLTAGGTSNVPPVGGGVFCGQDMSWCRLTSISAKMSPFCPHLPHPV